MIDPEIEAAQQAQEIMYDIIRQGPRAIHRERGRSWLDPMFEPAPPVIGLAETAEQFTHHLLTTMAIRMGIPFWMFFDSVVSYVRYDFRNRPKRLTHQR